MKNKAKEIVMIDDVMHSPTLERIVLQDKVWHELKGVFYSSRKRCRTDANNNDRGFFCTSC